MATWRALYLRQTVGLSEIDAARELMDNYPVLRAELNRYISERIYGPRDRTGAIPIRQDDEEGVN